MKRIVVVLLALIPLMGYCQVDQVYNASDQKSSPRAASKKKTETTPSRQQKAEEEDMEGFQFMMFKTKDRGKKGTGGTLVTINDTEGTKPFITLADYDASGNEKSKVKKDLYSIVGFDFSEFEEDSVTAHFASKDGQIYIFSTASKEGVLMIDLLVAKEENGKSRLLEHYYTYGDTDDSDVKMWLTLVKDIMLDGFNLYNL